MKDSEVQNMLRAIQKTGNLDEDEWEEFEEVLYENEKSKKKVKRTEYEKENT